MAASLFYRARRRIVILLAMLAIVGTGASASAQTQLAGEWRQGTTLSAFAGAGTASSDMSAVSGVALGWEVTPRFGVKGRGTWFHPGSGDSAFAAILSPRFSLLPARALNPFLSVGVGMYRASFETTSAAMPGFYQRRMSGSRAQTFQDLLLALGGGAEIFVSTHFAIRPEASVLFVTTRRDTRVVPVYGAHLAFHFEAHPTSLTVR